MVAHGLADEEGEAEAEARELGAACVRLPLGHVGVHRRGLRAVRARGALCRLGLGSREMSQFQRMLPNIGGLVLGCIDAEFGSKYSLCSIFGKVTIYVTSAPLQTQHTSISYQYLNIQRYGSVNIK